MYYFNAIIKELQRDKSYDRIVISEDLEPFANNNSDAIEKFIFEKLDNISDEATGINGEDIPIILICSERRNKSDKHFVINTSPSFVCMLEFPDKVLMDTLPEAVNVIVTPSVTSPKIKIESLV